MKDTYTFWPDPEEKNWFASASPTSIKDFMVEHPRMSARALHELWATEKENTIYEAATLLPNSEKRAVILISLIGDLMQSIALMESTASVSRETSEAFATSVLSLVLKATNDIPMNEVLDTTNQSIVEKTRTEILQNVDQVKQAYNSQLR